MKNNPKRTVITGVGPLSSIGFGKTALWKSIIEGKTGLAKEDFFVDGEKIDSFYYHKIKYFSIDDFDIDKDILKDIRIWKERNESIDLFYLLAIVKLALADSKLQPKEFNGKIGLVLAHENPGLDQFYEDIINKTYDFKKQDTSKKKYFEAICNAFSKRGYDLQTFMFLFQVVRAFGIHGYSLFINNACASGLFAIEAGADIIRSGKCNCVVVAASDHTSIFKHLWFKKLNMYPEDGLIKPFAKNRDGFVSGDGGAGIVLEDLDSALKRKAHIYAEHLGGGFHLEGWKVAIPDMTSDSYKIAIETAIANSDVKKEDIDLIIPHGVGTQVTDAYEAKAIANIFGKNPKKPLITAFKPYIGHNLGSTALLETVILLLALENSLVPPTLNCDEVDPKLNIDLVRKATKVNFNTTLKTACGFAGYNAAVIFQKLGKNRT